MVARTRDAEFAILVSHFIAGQGLGRHLMRKLAKWARSKKLDRLYGDVLDSNEPMLQLAQSLGFKRVREAAGPGPELHEIVGKPYDLGPIVEGVKKLMGPA